MFSRNQHAFPAITPPSSQDIQPQVSTVEMVEQQELEKPSRLGWWYRIAAPRPPVDITNLQQREVYRRGRLISIALLMILVVGMIVMLTVGLFVNRALGYNLAVTLVVLLVAVAMNRRGQVIIAGILVVSGIDLSLMLNWLSYPTASIFLLPLLDLLVLPELFAVSLLPPLAVFVDAFIHIIFIGAALTFLFPQNPELRALLHTSSIQDALARPIVLQISVAVITYLWVTSATQAIARADRATTIAALERTMAEQAQLETEQKRELERSIQQIIQTHMRVANGDFSARVPLHQGAVLWEVAGSLNNLLSRLQRWRQDSLKLQRYDAALALYIQAQQQRPRDIIPWQPTETPIDILVQQHNTSVSQSFDQRHNEGLRPLQ